jgi:hypothetical protein
MPAIYFLLPVVVGLFVAPGPTLVSLLVFGVVVFLLNVWRKMDGD